MRVVVLADTHLRRSWPNRRLPEAAVRVLATADVILHAGDITQAEHLEELAVHAPVHAVLGNNDPELVDLLPETLELELAGVQLAMIHDSGPARGRERRLHDRFPDADVVVFGHSHIPWNAEGLDGQLLFNPGSPTERRRQPHRTLGVLDLVAGRVAEARIVALDGPEGPDGPVPPRTGRQPELVLPGGSDVHRCRSRAVDELPRDPNHLCVVT